VDFPDSQRPVESRSRGPRGDSRRPYRGGGHDRRSGHRDSRDRR
jgi:hypothetical protein